MSLDLLDAPPMADNKPKPKMVSVKLPDDILEYARIVSPLVGKTMTNLMADILRPALVQMEREEMTRRLGRTQPTPKRKTGK